MDPPPSSLIAILTSGLKKPKHQERATALLNDLVENHEVKVSLKPYCIMMIALWVMALVAMVMAGNYYSRHYKKQAIEMNYLTTFYAFDSIAAEGLTDEQKCLLGVHSMSELDQAKWLADKYSADPVYYMHYAIAHVDRHATLPDDYFETMQRIAPNNAMPLYYAAGVISREAYEKTRVKGERNEPRYKDGIRLRPRSEPSPYEVHDAKAMSKARRLLEEAGQLPEYERYSMEFVRKLLNLGGELHQPKNLVGVASTLARAWSCGMEDMQLYRVQHVLGVAAQQAVEQQDKEQLLRLINIRNEFLHREASLKDVSMISALIHQSVAHGSSERFLKASKQLGLESLATKFQAESDAFDDMQDEQEIRRKSDQEQMNPKACLIASNMAPVLHHKISEQPLMPVEAHEPLRRAEHAFAAQVGISFSSMTLLALGIIAFFLRFIFPKAIAKPAVRSVCLLKSCDWIWIIAAGAVVPLLIYVGATRFTPLSGHAYGIAALGFTFPLVPLICLLLSVLLASSLTFGWRLRMRMQMKRSQKGWSRAWLVALITAGLTPVVVYGWIVTGLGVSWGLNLFRCITSLYTLGGVLLVILAWGLWKARKRKAPIRFQLVATAAAITPCLPVTILGLSLMLPMHIAEEAHWVAQDSLMLHDASKKDFGVYEGRVARQVYRETQAALNAGSQ